MLTMVDRTVMTVPVHRQRRAAAVAAAVNRNCPTVVGCSWCWHRLVGRPIRQIVSLADCRRCPIAVLRIVGMVAMRPGIRLIASPGLADHKWSSGD